MPSFSMASYAPAERLPVRQYSRNGLVLGQGEYLRVKGRAKKIHVHRAGKVSLAELRRGAHVHNGQALRRILQQPGGFIDADILGGRLNGHQQDEAYERRRKAVQPRGALSLRTGIGSCAYPVLFAGGGGAPPPSTAATRWRRGPW